MYTDYTVHSVYGVWVNGGSIDTCEWTNFTHNCTLHSKQTKIELKEHNNPYLDLLISKNEVSTALLTGKNVPAPR